MFPIEHLAKEKGQDRSGLEASLSNDEEIQKEVLKTPNTAICVAKTSQEPLKEGFQRLQDGSILCPLRNRKREIVAHTRIDGEDYERVKDKPLTLLKIYATIRIDGVRHMLSHFLCGFSAGPIKEYINGDTLDNRKSNLRTGARKPQAATRDDVRQVPDMAGFEVSRNGKIYSVQGNELRQFVRLKRDGRERETHVEQLKPVTHIMTDTWQPIEGLPDYEIHYDDKRIRNTTTKDLITAWVYCGTSAKSVDMLYEKTWIEKEHWVAFQETEQARGKFPNLSFDGVFELPPKRRSALLFMKRPDLLPELETGVNVGTLLTKSRKTLKWNPKCGHSYSRAVFRRVEVHSPCVICDPLPHCDDCVKIGTATENWLAVLLRSLPLVQRVDETGHMYNGIDDLVLTLTDGTKRLAQGKTLSKRNGNNFGLSYDQSYPERMLILAVDNERSKFFVSYAQDFKNYKGKNGRGCAGISFGPTSKNFQDKKFNNAAAFAAKVLELLPQALQEHELKAEDRYSANFLVEKQSRERLRTKSESFGFEFVDHKDNISSVDLYINGKSVQHKFSTEKRAVALEWSSLGKNRKRKCVPYSCADGIEIFSFEHSRHLGDFLLIPASVLVEAGFLSNAADGGKVKFSAYDPADLEQHYARYWNNFTIFKKEEKQANKVARVED